MYTAVSNGVCSCAAGRIIIFYGNKSSTTLLNFSTEVPQQELAGLLEVDLQAVPNSLDAGAQLQQVLNVSCQGIFFKPPRLEIKFR